MARASILGLTEKIKGQGIDGPKQHSGLKPEGGRGSVPGGFVSRRGVEIGVFLMGAN